MKKLPYRIAPLLVALASSCAFAVTPERPQPSDYDNFNAYIRALVDYRKSMDPTLPVDRDPAAAQDDSKESLEDAVAKAQSGWSPGYTDSTRSTSKTFPLQPISSDDLNSVESPDSISGVIALANNRLDQLKPSRDVSSEELDITDERLRSDAYYVAMRDVALDAVDMLGGTIILENDDGYSVVSLEANKLQDGGLSLNLSAKLRARVSLVDKSGLPGSRYTSAGAVVLDPLRLDIHNLAVDIHGLQRGQQRYIQVDSYLNGGIELDLSRTRMGVANWLGGRRTGTMTPFLTIGDDGHLNIASGTVIRTTITRPDARTPFATVSGRIGDIALSDVSLIDNVGGGVIHVAKMSLTGINLLDTKVYFRNGAIELDTGRGLTDVGLSLERLALGTADNAHTIGDLYVSGMHVSNTITIRAH